MGRSVVNEDPILRRYISYRVAPLRWLRRQLLSIGLGYVHLKGTEEDFWAQAGKHAPWFSSPLSVEEIDELLGDWPKWLELKDSLKTGDRILPFAFNVGTMAMRQGYVVVRDGRPVGGVVTLLS